MAYFNYLGVAMPESRPETGNILGTAAGNETVQAPAGDTSVSGNGGGDLLVGSAGDNRFWITDPNDRVVDNAGGVDTEIGWLTIQLAPNIENLTVHGDFSHAVGNSLDNLIIGDGRSWLYGGAGNDVLVGATNTTTTFVVHAGEGADVIYNWQGADQLQLTGYNFTNAAQVRAAMTQQGNDVVLHLSPSETLTFRGTSLQTTAFLDRQFLLPLDRARLGGLTFDDEFNSLSIWDPSHQTGQWSVDFGGNLKDQWAYTLAANGEIQLYVHPGFEGLGEHDLHLNPFAVNNGVLSISAQMVPQQYDAALYSHAWTSGMLNTLNSFQQKYGYFEVRAELPAVKGTWPAFWMVPWPYKGGVEGDVMEALGLAPTMDFRRALGSDVDQYDNILKINPSGMHTYGMLWTPTEVSFYFDDVEVMTGPAPANWTDPMGMILNLAVGGWGGNANPADYPATMKIDYVRAYALADGSTVVKTGVPPAPTATLQDAGGPTSGVATAQVAFADSGLPVSSAQIQILGGHPAGPLPDRTFAVWEESGAVLGAVSSGGSLAAPTTLGASGFAQFANSGTWLNDGKLAVGYFAPDPDTGQTGAWALVFDPTKLSFTRHELGPSVGNISFVATGGGGFAVSWHAPDGSVMARGYDEYAYGGDIPGWYGPVRQVAGDLVGVSAGGLVIAQTPQGGEQLYSMVGSSTPTGSGSGVGQVITGTSGDDSLSGTGGADTIQGGDGHNIIRGFDGPDLITGGAGFDDINGNTGDDVIQGGPGDDWVVGGQNNDLLFGGQGNDLVYGNLGADTLDGGKGADVVRGGQGNDLITGGEGDDWLSGDRGDDTLTGGPGADTFHTFGDTGIDRVTDFNRAEGDRVLLDPGTTYSVAQVGADTVISMNGGGQMILMNVTMTSLTGAWIGYG